MGPAAGGCLTQPPQPSGAGEGSWASGEWSRLCACPHSSSPGPALPLLDPMTWFISQLPPPTPSFHQRSWASSPGAGEGRPPPSRPRWVLADALCDVGEAFCSGSSISCWLLLACVVAGGSGPWRPPPSGERAPKGGAVGLPQRWCSAGEGLPPAGGQGAAVVGPGRPHLGLLGPGLAFGGPESKTSQLRLGLLVNLGQRGELCRQQPRG